MLRRIFSLMIIITFIATGLILTDNLLPYISEILGYDHVQAASEDLQGGRLHNLWATRTSAPSPAQ